MPGIFDTIAARAQAQNAADLARMAGLNNPVATIAVSDPRRGSRGSAAELSRRRRLQQLEATGQLDVVDELLSGPRQSVIQGLAPGEDRATPVQRSIIQNAQQRGTTLGGDESARQEALSRALFAATPGNPVPISAQEQRRQDAANRALLLDQPQEFFEFAEQQVQAARRRAREATAEQQAIAQAASNPGYTEAQIQEAVDQHAMRFPEFNTPERPKTLQEQIQEFQRQEEQQFQDDMNTFTEWWAENPLNRTGEMPPVPARRNEKGVLEPIVDPQDIIRLQIQERERIQADRREVFQQAMDSINTLRPQPLDELAGPEEQAAHQEQMRFWRAWQHKVRSQFVGGDAFTLLQQTTPLAGGSAVEPSPVRVQQAQATARASGRAFVATQAEYDALAPGTPYVDPQGNQGVKR